MTCPLCLQFKEKYPLIPDEEDPGALVHVLARHADGSPAFTSAPIRCAFEVSEDFSTDNWCCESLAHLRNAKDIVTVWHDDSNVGVLRIPVTAEEGVQQGMLVMSWYKNRGRTGRAIVLCDDEEPVILNLKTALHILGK